MIFKYLELYRIFYKRVLELWASLRPLLAPQLSNRFRIPLRNTIQGLWFRTCRLNSILIGVTFSRQRKGRPEDPIGNTFLKRKEISFNGYFCIYVRFFKGWNWNRLRYRLESRSATSFDGSISFCSIRTFRSMLVRVARNQSSFVRGNHVDASNSRLRQNRLLVNQASKMKKSKFDYLYIAFLTKFYQKWETL